MAKPQQKLPTKTKLTWKDLAREAEEEFLEAIKTYGFSLLLLGLVGSGKSTLLKTARRPTWIDMFDPRGGIGLRSEVSADKGLIVDTRWSHDDNMKPTVFKDWCKEMDKRLSNGFFDNIATYCIDSSTSWTQVIMNDIMSKRGTPGKEPDNYQSHWGPQKETIKKYMHLLQSQQCDLIVTGHLEPQYMGKGPDKRIHKYTYSTVGKLAEYIPSLFSEIWVATPKKKANGVDYRILTQSESPYVARSRLSEMGLLDQYEEPNIKAILKKVNFPHEDLEF